MQKLNQIISPNQLEEYLATNPAKVKLDIFDEVHEFYVSFLYSKSPDNYICDDYFILLGNSDTEKYPQDNCHTILRNKYNNIRNLDHNAPRNIDTSKVRLSSLDLVTVHNILSKTYQDKDLIRKYLKIMLFNQRMYILNTKRKGYKPNYTANLCNYYIFVLTNCIMAGIPHENILDQNNSYRIEVSLPKHELEIVCDKLFCDLLKFINTL